MIKFVDIIFAGGCGGGTERRMEYESELKNSTR